MKIPKKLRLFGDNWKVVRTGEGGSFSFTKKIIKIEKSKAAEEILMHEIMEACLVHLQYRFYGHEQGMEYRFFFDHSGLCRVANLFYQCLTDNKLI